MYPSWILSFQEQKDIARIYAKGFHTHEDLADAFNVSSGTIRKVLRAFGMSGLKPQISVEQAKILATAEKYHLSDEKLEQALNAPALSYPNVVRYVQGLDQDRLLTLFSLTALGEWLNKLPLKDEPNAPSN